MKLRREGVLFAFLGLAAVLSASCKTKEEKMKAALEETKQEARSAIDFAKAVVATDMNAKVPLCKGLLKEAGITNWHSVENVAAGSRVRDPPNLAEPTYTRDACYTSPHSCNDIHGAYDPPHALDIEDYAYAGYCMGREWPVAVVRATSWKIPKALSMMTFEGGFVDGAILGYDGRGKLLCKTPLHVESPTSVSYLLSNGQPSEGISAEQSLDFNAKSDLERQVRDAVSAEVGLESRCKK